ncbi:hypothetical protein ERHA54_29740 [Erwinia rhapontici]|uniref:Uncharacterized protein n=1 Tax=Erwinia rhapontici TaxID=55212 RepID=A0ABN6DQU9_ERWRD|nr:hypothetical protein [Erwinia rhapontici]MCS3607298.1 hypothetical protein [Erwinia rhapontici]TDT02178.1 hypothetical protein EDF84_101912 [Erwinia rhapontici]BCQ35467.1 hypothetical protein ERHA53_28100 [Erwinia rhapontici]BCQ40371.1 hypothetical protein ERHA54_29740 [Erwinia rhapontici]
MQKSFTGPVVKKSHIANICEENISSSAFSSFTTQRLLNSFNPYRCMAGMISAVHLFQRPDKA